MLNVVWPTQEVHQGRLENPRVGVCRQGSHPGDRVVFKYHISRKEKTARARHKEGGTQN